MKFKRLITAVDSHTAGQPARVIIGGVPRIPGNTMFEKKVWAETHMDALRTFLMFEPRGHGNMSGSIITSPTSQEADVGVLFIDACGFFPMCGHLTIATCTVLVETGMVAATEPETRIALDTPAGVVRAVVRVGHGVVTDVTFRNVPAFLYRGDAEVDVPTVGRVKLDIAWGGDFYAIVPAAVVGLELVPSRARDMIDIGTKIREAVYEQISVVHPENAAINYCNEVRFIGPAINPQANSRNVAFCGPEGLDRSPCGTGTSAEMATLYAKGELGLNEEFVSESIVGSLFYGKLIAQTQIGSYPAVVPTIRGSAYITGFQQIVLDWRDPWPRGFYVGPKSRWGSNF